MKNQLIVTVTSAEGQPSFTVSAGLSTAEIRRIVRDRFHLQCNGSAPGIPHSFAARLVADAEQQRDTGMRSGWDHEERHPCMLINPGHLRAF